MIQQEKKKVMLAWELGGSLGHVSRLVPLAKEFVEQDCEVTLVLRNLTHVPSILRDIHCLTLQAPISMQAPQHKRESLSFADILWTCGYFSANELFGLVAGWQSLYDLVQPDLLLLDYAPTALLAARIYDFKTAWIGGGFFCPPMAAPWPDFRPGKITSSHLMLKRENELLQTVNSVLQAMGCTTLNRLADIFEVDSHFLCTWPELDCYARPTDTQYWGVCIAPDYGQEIAWPNQAAEGIFCYLKHDQTQAEPILKVLQALDMATLVYISNLPTEWEQKYSSKNLKFAKTAVNLRATLPSARLVICPAGEGVIAAALLAGKPLLMAPTQAEQLSNAGKVEAMGAGINTGCIKQADLKKQIQKILSTPNFLQSAGAFAEKYKDFSSASQIKEIVAHCLDAMN